MSKKSATQDGVLTPNDQLEAFLAKNKGDHFNDKDDIDYKISSGSLNLDLHIGGFTPGLHRLVGPASSGKTSAALEVVRQLFLKIPKSRAIFVRTEGRLSEEIRERSGLKFTSKFSEWDDNTVFVFQSNIYETVINLIREVITNNPLDYIYAFIIDSADGLILKDDMDKEFGSERVAGAPYLTKKFLQKMANGMAKFGHMCFFLGQLSTEIKLDPYAKVLPRQVGGSGGRAAEHWANIVLEYQPRYAKDLFLEKPTEKPHPNDNKIIGHICRAQIKKSDNEKNFVTIEIPIHYGQSAGNSIWREMEIADMLLSFNLIEKKAAWFTVTKTLIDDLAENKLTIPEKIQGMDNVRKYLEENPDVTKYLFNKFRELMG